MVSVDPHHGQQDTIRPALVSLNATGEPSAETGQAKLGDTVGMLRAGAAAATDAIE